MYEIIREGEAIIRIKKADKISKQMDVFYNPVMKLNRDISILLLNTIDSRNMQIALPLAGSGIRGIRFLKELGNGKIKSISFNDYSAKAVEAIISNLILNKISKFTITNMPNNGKTLKNFNNNSINNKKNNIIINNEDANWFLLNSSGFNYIDIDPFGSSNFMLDSAIKRISRNGILAVTNTDTAALTGTYPKACIRKYWSASKRDYMMHETGLRILIRKMQLVGMQYEKALFPIFSYFRDHYFRVFFQCVKGKKLCDEIAAGHGMFNNSGPLWLGDLWGSKLVNRMYGTLIKNPTSKKILKINSLKNSKGIFGELGNQRFPVSQKSKGFLRMPKNPKDFFSTIKNKRIMSNNQNYKGLLKFLKTIKDESKINAVGFYDMSNIAKKRKLGTVMKKEDIIKKIKKKGFKAANTHFSGTGIRSDIPDNKLMALL